MKQYSFFVVLLLMFCGGQAFAQGIFSVNPNPVAAADFQSLQAAIDSVPANSVLMVHGGSYGNITLDKQLVLIGPGYFLSQNPETQATPVEALVPGASIDSAAAGSVISGLTFTTVVYIMASGCILERNRFLNANLVLNGANSCIIRQNYSSQQCGAAQGTSIGVIFENNIFWSIQDFTTASGVYIQGTFTNNIFTGYLNNVAHLPENSTYLNNICSATLPGGVFHPAIQNNNNTVMNNLYVGSVGHSIDTSQGNQSGFNFSDLFVGPGGQSLDGQYQFAPNSPAIGAGQGGVDCGIFAGTHPYILSGIPFVPNIHFLDVPFTGTSGSGIDVHIKVKANQ